MVINTPKGRVIISGCGHAGMVNTLDYAQELVGPSHIHAAYEDSTCYKRATNTYRGRLKSW